MSKEYGTLKAQIRLPTTDLIIVPHKGEPLIVSPAFGPNTYNSNVEAMNKEVYNSEQFPNITFREPLTQESISAVAFEFESRARPEIFDPRWLQAGRIVRTQEGVFTNTTELDEAKLKAMLDSAEKVNGIYLINDQIAFAPYESFETGVQEGEKFAEGGLARALEHTEEKVAENLAKIAAKGFYPRGVDVWRFDSVKKPISKVACLGSSGFVDDDGLDVDGGDWDDYYSGFAFGVRETGEAS